ncbi:hypothetical protein C9374_007078 [Naegleria lovaniensis]|uniref:DUF4326 domain-containing protein n=1 Tax=Naegleria lovaniensis TaxID=51637 RepID=A0AA88KRU5_NAELO|nr:uncharacterized protein C9374_007078 [Naegleria lovaniensis]KAG2393547.1 hypothetical protein C9374_007078 [Naegleria lovaniensis]
MSQSRSFNFQAVHVNTTQNNTSSNTLEKRPRNKNVSSTSEHETLSKKPMSSQTRDTSTSSNIKSSTPQFKSQHVAASSSSNNNTQSGQKNASSKSSSSTNLISEKGNTSKPHLVNNSGTRVVKLQRRNGQIVQDCQVYIGRAMTMGGWNLPHSKWGNPYPVSTCGGSAEVACQKYRDYILRRDDLLQDLEELDGKVLGCWCKSDPSKACHGDTLVELLEMKKRGELQEYVQQYRNENPEPLYPLPQQRKK